MPGHGVRARHEFGFEVLVGDRAVNNWHYRLPPSTDAARGSDVTGSRCGRGVKSASGINAYTGADRVE